MANSSKWANHSSTLGEVFHKTSSPIPVDAPTKPSTKMLAKSQVETWNVIAGFFSIWRKVRHSVIGGASCL